MTSYTHIVEIKEEGSTLSQDLSLKVYMIIHLLKCIKIL